MQFSKKYLRRVPLRQYKLWEGLGKRYETNVTVLNEAESKALIRLPEGKYSDLQLKAILRKYREVQLDFTPEMEVFHMLLETCHTKN